MMFIDASIKLATFWTAIFSKTSLKRNVFKEVFAQSRNAFASIVTLSGDASEEVRLVRGIRGVLVATNERYAARSGYSLQSKNRDQKASGSFIPATNLMHAQEPFRKH